MKMASDQFIIDIPQRLPFSLPSVSISFFGNQNKKYLHKLPEPILKSSLIPCSTQCSGCEHHVEMAGKYGGNDKFQKSIRMLMKMAEHQKPVGVFSITKVCEDLSFQRRRLCDVINVLESVGCCQKIGVGSFMWFGLNNVVPYLLKIQKKFRINSKNAPLESLFPDDKCISISNMTTKLVMFFFALQRDSLDIMKLGKYLSRSNQRYKSTMCKLYQISNILEAAGLIAKCEMPSKIKLNNSYFVYETVEEKNSLDDILSIENLLNRPRDSKTIGFIEARIIEFNSIVNK